MDRARRNSFQIFLVTVFTVVSLNSAELLLCFRERPAIKDGVFVAEKSAASQELSALLQIHGEGDLRKWLPGSSSLDRDGEIVMANIYRFKLSEKSAAFAALKDFKDSELLLYAEEMPVHQMTYRPNDPYMQNYQWYLEQIGAYEAWDRWDIAGGERPVDKKVIIGIIDSGVDITHPDLMDNIFINQGEIPPSLNSNIDRDQNGRVDAAELLSAYPDDHNANGRTELQDLLHNNSPLMDGKDNDGNDKADDLLGWDMSSGSAGDNNPYPPVDEAIPFGLRTHGTHVAGIAAATTDNNMGIAGVAYDALILPVKTAADDDEEGQIREGFPGLVYAAKQGAHILNASWGNNSYSSSEQAVVNMLVDQYGCLLVAAAGNGTDEGEEYARFYPASYNKVLSVTALGQNDVWGQWATYHETVDIAAPGENITSTVIYSPTAMAGTGRGTSMAAPVVSGAAALLLGKAKTLTPRLITEILKNSSENIYTIFPNDQYSGKLGAGRLNISTALHVIVGIEESRADEVQNGKIASVHPNPFNSVTHLHLDIGHKNNAQLNIYDISGRKIYKRQVTDLQQKTAVELDLSAFPSGLYFLVVDAGEEQVMRKISLLK